MRTTLRPATSATLSAPSSNSLEMAQRETKPMPSPASTADLIASVESRSITFLKDLSLKPAFSRASSTTWREPEPCSRIRSLEATNWSRDKRSDSKAGGVIKTNSSCMKGSVRMPRSRAGPSMRPIASLFSRRSCTIWSVLPLWSENRTRGFSSRKARSRRGRRYCAIVVDAPRDNSPETFPSCPPSSCSAWETSAAIFLA